MTKNKMTEEEVKACDGIASINVPIGICLPPVNETLANVWISVYGLSCSFSVFAAVELVKLTRTSHTNDAFETRGQVGTDGLLSPSTEKTPADMIVRGNDGKPRIACSRGWNLKKPYVELLRGIHEKYDAPTDEITRFFTGLHHKRAKAQIMHGTKFFVALIMARYDVLIWTDVTYSFDRIRSSLQCPDPEPAENEGNTKDKSKKARKKERLERKLVPGVLKPEQVQKEEKDNEDAHDQDTGGTIEGIMDEPIEGQDRGEDSSNKPDTVVPGEPIVGEKEREEGDDE